MAGKQRRFFHNKIYKEETDMGKQMEETRKGFMEGDFGGDRLDLLITADLLEEAGIDPVDEIEIFCTDGMVIIRQRSLLDRLPDGLRECFDATGLSEEVLEMALREEACSLGGFGKLLEKLESNCF